MKKFSFKPVLFMFIITFVFTAVLATLNSVTAERIKLNILASEQRSFLYTIGIYESDLTSESVNQKFSEHINEIEVNGFTLYEAYKDNELIGYIIPIEGSAVWGGLRALLALSTDFTKVLGLDILSHNETPGLGGRIDEKSFKEQFRGIELNKDSSPDYILYKPNPDGQIDSISGATGTSNALLRIINENLHEFFNNVKEEI